MKYVTLNNGIQMPMLGYGTWDLRGEEGKKAIVTIEGEPIQELIGA